MDDAAFAQTRFNPQTQTIAVVINEDIGLHIPPGRGDGDVPQDYARFGEGEIQQAGDAVHVARGADVEGLMQGVGGEFPLSDVGCHKRHVGDVVEEFAPFKYQFPHKQKI